MLAEWESRLASCRSTQRWVEFRQPSVCRSSLMLAPITRFMAHLLIWILIFFAAVVTKTSLDPPPNFGDPQKNYYDTPLNKCTSTFKKPLSAYLMPLYKPVCSSIQDFSTGNSISGSFAHSVNDSGLSKALRLTHKDENKSHSFNMSS